MSGKIQNIAHAFNLHIFRSLKSQSLNIVKLHFLIRADQICRIVLITGVTKYSIPSCFYTFKRAKNIEWQDGEILSQTMVIIPCIQEPFTVHGRGVHQCLWNHFSVRGLSTANRILAKYDKRWNPDWWFAFEYFNKRLQIVLLSLSKWKS